MRASYDQYLALNESSDELFEWHDGVIVPLASASPEHARIAGRLFTLLAAGLGTGPCLAIPQSLKVHVATTKRTLVPDITVVCGPLQRAAVDAQAITNPTVVFEVLSPTTEDYDRGAKFHHYRRLASLQAFVTVRQDMRAIQVARRAGDLWAFDDLEGGELAIEPISIRIALDEIYRDALGPIVP